MRMFNITSLALASSLLLVGCAGVPQPTIPITPQDNPKLFASRYVPGRPAKRAVDSRFDLECTEKPFYGYHGTCWRQWPEGWVPCPEQIVEESVKPGAMMTPNVGEPIPPVDIQPGPQTPQTPAPQTPAPQTPAPQTPAPQTPAPQTPAPQTPAPQTPAPQTPAPVPTAPAPVTPATPAPATPAPATPAPATPVPTAPVPGTPGPATPAPAAPAPAVPGTPIVPPKPNGTGANLPLPQLAAPRPAYAAEIPPVTPAPTTSNRVEPAVRAPLYPHAAPAVGTPTPATELPDQTTEKTPAPTDEAVARNIAAKIGELKRNGRLRGFTIDLRVIDRVAVLIGSVQTEGQRKLVEAAVNEAAGVKSLRSELQVAGVERQELPAVVTPPATGLEQQNAKPMFAEPAQGSEMPAPAPAPRIGQPPQETEVSSMPVMGRLVPEPAGPSTLPTELPKAIPTSSHTESANTRSANTRSAETTRSNSDLPATAKLVENPTVNESPVTNSRQPSNAAAPTTSPIAPKARPIKPSAPQPISLDELLSPTNQHGASSQPTDDRDRQTTTRETKQRSLTPVRNVSAKLPLKTKPAAAKTTNLKRAPRPIALDPALLK